MGFSKRQQKPIDQNGAHFAWEYILKDKKRIALIQF